MNFVSNFVCVFLALFFKVSLAVENNQFPVLETILGKYVGLSLRSRNGREYFSFTGIPYAYPPARFEPSTLVNLKWDGVREARNPGSKCIQSGLNGYSSNEGREDENCLFLNVYVPKEGIEMSERLPVMVYIHEGLFSSGEGVKHGAKYFMDQNVVLVTINYRLGVFGFLNTGDGVVRGNLGMMDQVNALKWVQEHIDSFGGDPDKVTIFGNDAGAVSVSLLLLSPSANGLFHRAIAQSGSSLVPWGWQSNPKANAMKLGQILNCSTISSRELVRCLKNLPAMEIGRAQQKFIKWFMDPIATFVPSLELAMEGRESFLTQHPLSVLMSGNFQKVPLMTGIVEDEGLLHAAGEYKLCSDERRLTEINNEWFKFAPVTLLYGEIEPKETRSRISTRISQFYFGGKFVGEETLQNLTNLYTDRYFLRGIKLAALLHARFASVFPYIFSYQGDHSNLGNLVGVRSVLGVAHTDELQYLFNSESDPEFLPGSESERISKNLVQLWVSFAKTGVPGQLDDRRTMLGELNWIFTAITDTIAWNLLPRSLFQRLFRQDLLVASLFRNYLLAERIMRTYDCTPTSSPKLPPTSQHPMWHAWDFALDLCLTQLPPVLEEIAAAQLAATTAATAATANGSNGANNGSSGGTSAAEALIVTNHTPSPFFEEQLTAFQVWLSFGSEKRSPPEQLPIVLQVLLSQVHRVRALELLGRFLDLGWWAINLALSVGIFPYVLKLLQSSARELRPLLVFIWAKILAVDHSCQSDLVRDGSHKYFISMVGDTSLPFEHRTMAVFVLTNIVRAYRPGQQAALQANSIATCLEALDECDSELRRWVCICLGLTWAEFSAARWCGVRDSAHEKIYKILEDPNPEVRAAAVYALGTFINCGSERTEHSNSIDHSVAMTIVNKLGADECSPLVRQEIVVALHNFVLLFENNFIAIEQQNLANQELQMSSPAGGSGMRRISSQTRMRILAHANNPLATVTGAESHNTGHDSMRRVASSSSLSSLMASFSPLSAASTVGGIFGKVWLAMAAYEKDPYPGVALLTRAVMEHIRQKAREIMSTSGPIKLGLGGLSPIAAGSTATTPSRPGSAATSVQDNSGDNNKPKEIIPLIGTKYNEWCWDRFARPSIPGSANSIGLSFGNHVPETIDSQDPVHHTREWRYMRNSNIRRECFKRPKSFPGKVDEQIFSSRTLHSHSSSSSAASSPSFTFNSSSSPSIVKLHEYEKLLVASEGSMFCIYDIESPKIICKWENSKDSRITSIEWANSHDESLVMIGSDDGSVRFWNPDYERGRAKLVTAWNALSDLCHLNKSSKSYGLIVKWDSEREKVLASGDARVVRVWDIKTELKKGEYPTGSDCPVTSIDIHRCEPQLGVLGLEEGAVRLMDFRLPPAECGVVTWREFGDSWIVGATLRYDRSVVAGSANGKIRFFDLRSRAPTKTVDTATDITALSIHPHLPYFASGCLNHSVNVYGFLGQSAFLANGIREGLFISGRMGAVSSLHFHPYKPLLATADSYSVNVYKSRGSSI